MLKRRLSLDNRTLVWLYVESPGVGGGFVWTEEVTLSASAADSLNLDALGGIFSAIMSRPASDEYWLDFMLCSVIYSTNTKGVRDWKQMELIAGVTRN